MDKFFVILMVLAALILLYILWCFIEPFFLVRDKAVIKRSPKTSSGTDISIKKLPMISASPEAEPDIRLFFFSDIHAEWCPVTSKRICEAIRKANGDKPLDAVIFGGDIITYPQNAAKGYKYINNISRFCNESKIPFYGVTGNHDVRLSDFSRNAGFISLDNNIVPLTSRTSGKGANLIGITDSGTRKCEWPPMPHQDGRDASILVVHDPDSLIHIDPLSRPDFMLSGHLHGGQMKFPFKIEFRILRKKDKLPNMGAVQGVYDINGTTVFISRGLGCGLMPFRFLSVPEVTVVEICL